MCFDLLATKPRTMNTANKAHKQELKVYVKMHDGTRLMGLFYLGESDRLQDVMNDERSFLPLHAYDDKGKKRHTIMLAKRYIEQVEEFDVSANTVDPVLPPAAPSQAPRPVERRTMNMSELSLDDKHFTLKRATDKPLGEL